MSRSRRPWSCEPKRIGVRGEAIVIDATVAVCPHCGEDIGDTRVDGVTLDRVYDIYRARHNMLSTQQIKDVRTRYGMSLREFSRFLGFGEQTYASYENGSLPDELPRSHDQTRLHSRGRTIAHSTCRACHQRKVAAASTRIRVPRRGQRARELGCVLAEPFCALLANRREFCALGTKILGQTCAVSALNWGRLAESALNRCGRGWGACRPLIFPARTSAHRQVARAVVSAFGQSPSVVSGSGQRIRWIRLVLLAESAHNWR